MSRELCCTLSVALLDKEDLKDLKACKKDLPLLAFRTFMILTDRLLCSACACEPLEGDEDVRL